jgi:hypothetical protein
MLQPNGGHSRFDEVDEQPLTVPRVDGPTNTASLGRGRLMLRFAFGVVDLAQERVGAVLAACKAVAPQIPPERTVSAAVDVRHALLGALSDAAAGASRVPARLRRRWSRAAAATRRRAAAFHRAGKVMRRLPGVPGTVRRLQAWRDGKKIQLVRWTERGRRERAESRALAMNALTVLRENMVARVSDSPDVKRVIREESEGIAVTAVGGLREGSARADDLAEEAVGRLFGRWRARRAP